MRSFLRSLLVTIAIVGVVVPAEAHTPTELQEWKADWTDRADQGLTFRLMYEFRDMVRRHPAYFRSSIPRTQGFYVRSQPPGTDRGPWSADVMRWEPLLVEHFPADIVDNMLCLVKHESEGLPYAVNPTSSATGLLQIMGFWHVRWPGDYKDGAFNIEIARRIYDIQGLGAWSPYNRGLCHG